MMTEEQLDQLVANCDADLARTRQRIAVAEQALNDLRELERSFLRNRKHWAEHPDRKSRR